MSYEVNNLYAATHQIQKLQLMFTIDIRSFFHPTYPVCKFQQV